MFVTKSIACFVACVAICSTISIHGQNIDDELIDNSLSPGLETSENPQPKPQIDWVKISEAPPHKVVQPIGATIELECEATGSPAPSIYWVRGNNPQAVVTIFQIGFVDIL